MFFKIYFDFFVIISATKRMSTNPLGPGTRNISTNVPNELYISVYEMATNSGVKIGEFVRALMRFAQDKKVIVRENPEDKANWVAAVKADLHPLPEVRHEVIFTGEFQQKSLSEMVVDSGVQTAKGTRLQSKGASVKASRKMKVTSVN